MHRNQFFRQAFVADGKPILILTSGYNLMNFITGAEDLSPVAAAGALM